MTTIRNFALILISISLILSCDPEPKPPQAIIPEAPNLLTAIEITHNTIALNWNDESNNEEGFQIELGITGVWHEHAIVNADITEYLVDELVANTEYMFRVYAFNQAGNSANSNEITVFTESNNPPPAPTNITAIAVAPTVVQVEWSDTAPMAVNFLVDRRTISSSWTRVGQVGDNIEIYSDSTCSAASLYYYRVGAQVNDLLTWSVDSAEVTTPNLGAPFAPSELEALVIVGTGVHLAWADNSLDEMEFQIRRNQSGQQFQMIDTVASNILEYLDILGEDVGSYNYQVRAANANGVSAWSSSASARYEYCSDGAVPICMENYWTYEVDPTSGPNYNVRRQIRQVAYPGGVDYYLLVEFVGDSTDTLVYWRNFENGLYQDNYPLDGSAAELLLRVPATGGGFWNFQGDSVIVTSASTTVQVQGTTYTGVTIYQRFSRTSNRSTKYYLKPLTVGIIKEEEFENSSLRTTRELFDSYIRN